MSKLGFHVQGFTPAAVAAVTAQRGAAVIKTMDLQPWAIEALQQWKQNNPGGLVTYRMWIGPEAEGAGAQIERWKEYCDRLAQYVKESAPHGLVDAVYIPFNEITPYAGAELDRHCALLPQMCEYLRGQWIHHGGMKVIAGNFSVTTPHPPEAWGQITGAMRNADYLSLHRYSKSSLREGREHLYDFEEIYARNPALPPLILGEFGVDGALWTDESMPRDERFQGWQAFMDAQTYAAQLSEANDRLSNLDYVAGACVFNLDQYPPVDWSTYLYAGQSEILRVFNGERVAAPDSLPIAPTITPQLVQDPPPWLPQELLVNWRQWRGDDRNEWKRGSGRERLEFWKHAKRIGVDVDRYTAVPATPAPPTTVQDSVGPIARMMADETGIDPALWQGVIDIETGGCGMTDDGYPICRFEVAQWRRRNGDAAWSQAAPFFEGEQSWQGGDDKVNLDGSWRPIHGDQAFRRSVIVFASTFGDRDEAFASTSWGLFQLMGWHHDVAGYPTAEAMAGAFAESEEVQARGYLAWARQAGAVEALQNKALAGFVRVHNGNGQVGRFTQLLDQAARRHGWGGAGR